MLNEMISLVPDLLPENRILARSYLYFTWEIIHTITDSLSLESRSTQNTTNLFKDHIRNEEDRIKANLNHVHYLIDGVDTLYLVAGPGRIEKVNELVFLYNGV